MKSSKKLREKINFEFFQVGFFMTGHIFKKNRCFNRNETESEHLYIMNSICYLDTRNFTRQIYFQRHIVSRENFLVYR